MGVAMAEMLAAFFRGPRQVEVREVAAPEAGPGEVLLRVRACGICGSDLHFYRGELPALPHISPGHELAGEVVAFGEGVQGWSAGQRVIVEPLWVCRECPYCRRGHYQLCPQRKLMGTFAPGGMAQYIAVPAYTLYPLPDGLDFELGALVEPLAVAVHGLHLANLAAGERVLVLGSGSLGLMAVLAARGAGAGEVMATYRHPHQGEAALALGASRVLAADEAGGRELISEAQRRPIDVVVETVGGKADTLQQAMNLVGMGGRIVVLGLFTQASSLNPLALMLKEVHIVGGITYCRPGRHSDFDVALGIITAQPERARGVISHRFPLAEAAEAFATAVDKSRRSLKVQVAP